MEPILTVANLRVDLKTPRGTLNAVVGEAGLKLEMLSWFNSLLFPLAAGARVAGRLHAGRPTVAAMGPIGGVEPFDRIVSRLAA